MDDIDNASNYLLTFCMQLVHHSQLKWYRWFLSGSILEISPSAFSIKKYKVSADMLDVDLMVSNTRQYAFHRSVTVPPAYTGGIIRIYTDDVHPGYVRLIQEENNTELSEIRQRELRKLPGAEYIHGPAVLMNNSRFILERTFPLSNATDDKAECENIDIKSYDFVFFVHSPYWPVEASDWITRTHLYGFPSKSVIQQIVSYGCDFVQVSHNRLSNENEWRSSFSKAELFIVESLSVTQKIAYVSLWVLNKRFIASSKLCSYYFKTLMFWACEIKPTQFWHEDLLFQSLRELLIEMMQCVKSKFCVNYFIPANNMMDHLIDVDISVEVEALWRCLQSEQHIYEVIDSCRYVKLVNWIFNIESPSWVNRAFLIYGRVDNVDDCFNYLYSTDLITDLQYALLEELSDIYAGLRFQLNSVGCVTASEKHSFSRKSESHLLHAASLCESQERDVIYNPCERFVRSAVSVYKLCDTDVSSGPSTHNVQLDTNHTSTTDRQDPLNGSNEQKWLLKSKQLLKKYEHKLGNNDSSENVSKNRNVNILLHNKGTIYNSSHSFVQLYKEWPGQSPTVNISWFIAMAYLANLYYTTQRDVSLTIQTCDDIIDVYRQSSMNVLFAEKTFPVILSTQWSCIYDKEIQEMLGFYSLCSYVLDNSSSRSVYLGVCPVQFALYVKVRTTVEIFRMNQNVTNYNSSCRCVKDCFEHESVSLCENHVNSMLLTMLNQLHNPLMKILKD